MTDYRSTYYTDPSKHSLRLVLEIFTKCKQFIGHYMVWETELRQGPSTLFLYLRIFCFI